LSRRTLSIHAGGIGDFLLTLPALSKLAAGGTLEVAGARERVELAVLGGIARAAHSIDAIGFHSLFSSPSPTLCEALQRFDRVIVWMTDRDGSIEQGLRAIGPREVRCIPGLPTQGSPGHAAQWFCERVGVPHDGGAFLLKLPYEKSNLTLLHPGSGGRTKNWPAENFAALAKRLEGAGHEVAWIRGPAEEDDATYPPGARLLPDTTLSDLAKLLAGANGYVGNDSGITHLASIVGCRTVALFGPTDPARWAPIGPQTQIVFAENWPTVGTVHEAMLKHCSPADGV